jgi:hypothetical protein
VTTPILLISLPRSGSTLVQRVLAAHPGVATASEPWLLLPLLLPLRDDVPAPGGWQPRIHTALEDFAGVLPDGRRSYERAVGAAANALYAEAAAGAPFFLDKTPPYFLIVDEIVATLPEARIVVLWRNPLAVLASVVETFCGGRWRPQDYPTSLEGGLERLVDGVRSHRDRIHTVRYEDLVGGEGREWQRLCEFAGFEFDPAALRDFSGVRLEGEMGDAVGTAVYRQLEQEPNRKWRQTIHNPLRRRWASRYLDWIGAERLQLMGYDLGQLQGELREAGGGGGNLGGDTRDAIYAAARGVVKKRMLRGTG